MNLGTYKGSALRTFATLACALTIAIAIALLQTGSDGQPASGQSQDENSASDDNPTQTPTPTETSTSTPSPTDTATATGTPTLTPTATSTPTKLQVCSNGIVVPEPARNSKLVIDCLVLYWMQHHLAGTILNHNSPQALNWTLDKIHIRLGGRLHIRFRQRSQTCHQVGAGQQVAYRQGSGSAGYFGASHQAGPPQQQPDRAGAFAARRFETAETPRLAKQPSRRCDTCGA